MSRIFKAFVLMSFSLEHKNTYDLAIKEACRSCKLSCRRLDEEVVKIDMLEELYEGIHQADIIIADLSGLNSNVLFETGYAFALNKQLILLTNDVKELPFNLHHLRNLVYNKNDLQGLKRRLSTVIKAYFKKIEFQPGQDASNLIPESEEKPLLLTGWNKWGDVSVYADTNTILVQGKVSVAGYFNDKLSRKLAGKTLVLYIIDTGASNFSMNRLLKITVNNSDRLLKPEGNKRLISNEYIAAADGKVEYVIPEDFDGKLGFVFYEAELNFLKISAFVK